MVSLNQISQLFNLFESIIAKTDTLLKGARYPRVRGFHRLVFEVRGSPGCGNHREIMVVGYLGS